MKFIILIIICIFLVIMFYTFLSHLRVDINEAKHYINYHNAKVIDVRTLFEWNYGHFKNAINMPIININKVNLSKNNISKNDYIIVYCNTGQRARRAAEKIYNLGYKNVKYIVQPYKFLN